MRINTKTGAIELLKVERDTLARNQEIVSAIVKHAYGDLQEKALAAEVANEDLRQALADQGKSEAELVAEAAGEKPPY